MKERPILFSGAMVRALLRDIDPKTQTRRIVKPQPVGLPWFWGGDEVDPEPGWFDGYETGRMPCGAAERDVNHPMRCPYGVPSDRLWVRETFFAYGRWETRFSEKKGRDEWHFIDMTLECDRIYQYTADGSEVPLAQHRGGTLPGWWKRPAIHMPRAVSRTALDVTGVRVERLQSIGEEDACEEGAYLFPGEGGGWKFACGEQEYDSAIEAYQALWDSLNAARGCSWDKNPWVWVVEFKRIDA